MARDKVLPYTSGHHAANKIGVAKNLVNRAFTNCSNAQLLSNELLKLEDIFKGGEYPPKLVANIVKQCKTGQKHDIERNQSVKKRKNVITMTV